jgi:hypothetical protein
LPATLPPWRYQQRSPAGCRTMIDRRPADRGARPAQLGGETFALSEGQTPRAASDDGQIGTSLR